MRQRIGIMTLHRAQNYGAVWQCWALKRMCEKLGHTVETIDFNPFGHYTYSGLLRHRPDKALSYILNFRNFNRFVDKKLNPTTHTEEHEWIEQNPPHDDIYIVGSDTVWCENVVGEFLNSYMLDFAPSSVKRISYAASMGGIFPQSPVFGQEIRKFASVSLREPQFVNETAKIYGNQVSDVCDPTLLITADEYAKEEKRKRGLPCKYIALFDLAGDPMVIETAKQIKKRLKLPIVNLTGKWLREADRNYLSITPEQWLYMMRNANYVCTNSFHGTAFSIIFRRPFVTVIVTKGGRAKTNGRVENLLQQCGLTDRLVTNLQQLETMSDVDYEAVNPPIEHYRTRSITWLKQAIEE